MSQIERFRRIFRVTSEKGLKTGVPPQVLNPENVEQVINELKTKFGAQKDDLVLRILGEYKGVLKGEVDNQVKINIELLTQNRESRKDPDLWCSLATNAKQLRSFDAAKVFFEIALTLNPNHSDANFNYGNLLRDQGDLDGAARRYRKCIEIDEDDYNAHNNLGDILFKRGHTAEAEREFKRALEIFPLHVKAYNNLAALYVRQGRYREAEACLEKAIDIDPNYQLGKTNLAKLRHHLAIKESKFTNLEPPLEGFQTLGKAKIKDGEIVIEKTMTDGTLSPIGGVNVKVRGLERYNNFSFTVEFEGDSDAMLEMAYIQKDPQTPLRSLPLPLIGGGARMTISGSLQPENPEEHINLSKVGVIRFSVIPLFPFRCESPQVRVRNLKIT